MKIRIKIKIYRKMIDWLTYIDFYSLVLVPFYRYRLAKTHAKDWTLIISKEILPKNNQNY